MFLFFLPPSVDEEKKEALAMNNNNNKSWIFFCSSRRLFSEGRAVPCCSTDVVKRPIVFEDFDGLRPFTSCRRNSQRHRVRILKKVKIEFKKKKSKNKILKKKKNRDTKQDVLYRY